MVHEVGSLSLWFAALESNDAYPSVEELIAKARAPVKREYLRQSGTRVLANTVVMTEETMVKLREEDGDDAEMMPLGHSIPKTSVEKKSKRQQRRDRKEVTSSWALKSTPQFCKMHHICPGVLFKEDCAIVLLLLLQECTIS
jgi:hypothetical protein